MRSLMAFLVSLSLAVNCVAECTIPVKSIEEGTPAQCKGFLFSPAKELEVRLLLKDRQLLELELNTTNAIIARYKNKDLEFEKIIALESQKTELWKTRAEDITLKYVAVEDKHGSRDFLFILAGIGLTVLAGWSLGQAAQGSK